MGAGILALVDSITTEEFLTVLTSFGSNFTFEGFRFCSRRMRLSCESRMVRHPSSVSMRGGGDTVYLDVFTGG